MNILKLMLCGSLLTTVSFSMDPSERTVDGINTGTGLSAADPETDAYIDSLTNPDTPFIDGAQGSLNAQGSINPGIVSEVKINLTDDIEGTILPIANKSADYSAVSTDNSVATEIQKIDTTSSAEITSAPDTKKESGSQSYFCCLGIF